MQRNRRRHPEKRDKMLISRAHRDDLCSALREIRTETLQIERLLMLDQIVPIRLALRAYSLGTQIDNLQLRIVDIYPEIALRRVPSQP
ncbi:MAG: hypothetical protein WAU69_01745 [Solirubrobacteraceae bacterium]